MASPKKIRSLHTSALLANVQRDLEKLFTSDSESILLIDDNGTIKAANNLSADWLNQDTSSLIGENLFHLFTPYGVPIKKWANEVLQKRAIRELDTRLRRHFINLRLIPIGNDNQGAHLIILGRDITENKKLDEQVRELAGQLERKVRERTAELETLNRQLTEDRKRAELLASLSEHLIRDTQDYRQLLEHITAEISDLLGDTCLIALFTVDLNTMEIWAITDRDTKSLPYQREQLLNQAINVEANPIVNAILRGERYSVQDVTQEIGAALLPPEFAPLLGKHGIKTLEVFPLHIGEHTLGLLATAREFGEAYSKAEISFINNLTSPLALAIHNARLFDQLTESQNQLRGLSQKLVQMQENQYSHLAEELHDRVGQDMTAININLNIMQSLLPKTVPEDVFRRLADTEQLVKESVKHMRSTMAEYRPPMLDQYGLAATLYWYSEQYNRRTQIPVIINDRHMKNMRLSPEAEIALFRIAQEALNNIAKHAHATQIDIELFEEKGNIMMAITDNGVGFDMKKQSSILPERWGLTLMQERARAINGKLILRSVPGKGTQIIVRVRNSS